MRAHDTGGTLFPGTIKECVYVRVKVKKQVSAVRKKKTNKLTFEISISVIQLKH